MLCAAIMSTDRDALTSRLIPFMTLSDGSDASLTAPPAPMQHYLNNDGRAVARFAVEGNIVSTLLRPRLLTGIDEIRNRTQDQHSSTSS